LEAAAFEEALRALDDALALVDPNDAGRRAALLERKGHAVRALGRFEECLTIWDEVVTVDASVGEADTAALLCWEMGSLYVWLDRFPEAFGTYARGIELLGDERSSLWALLAGATATVLGLAGLYEQAEPQFAEALPVAEAAGDERTLGRMLWGRTIAKWSNTRLAEALEDGRASIAHLRRAADLWTLVDALAWTAYPATYTGSVAEGRDLGQEAVDLGQRVGNFGGEILGRRAVAFANVLETADLEEFELRAREDLAAFESIRSPWVSQSHSWLSRVLLARGDLDGALHHADESVRLEPKSAWTGVGWSAKFYALAVAGDRDACRTMLDDVPAPLPEPGTVASMGQTTILYTAALGCATVGFADEAAALHALVVEQSEVFPLSPFDQTLAIRIAGVCAAAGEQWELAEEHFEDARRLADEWPNRLDRPHVLHSHARMLLARGEPADRERAHAMLAEALATYEALGMPLHADRARAILG
jgi:tetratricopeptide (TPR) repeat protein